MTCAIPSWCSRYVNIFHIYLFYHFLPRYYPNAHKHKSTKVPINMPVCGRVRTQSDLGFVHARARGAPDQAAPLSGRGGWARENLAWRHER